jgi:hypothetical protein
MTKKRKQNKVKAEKKKMTKSLEPRKKIDPSVKGLYMKVGFTIKNVEDQVAESSTKTEPLDRVEHVKAKVAYVEQRKEKKLKNETVEDYGKAGSKSNISSSSIVNSNTACSSSQKKVKVSTKAKEKNYSCVQTALYKGA